MPEPLGEMSQEDRHAIDERKALIESRARALAEEALEYGQPWVRRLAEEPTDSHDRDRWLLAVTAVAAYRDRYKVHSDLPLGGVAKNDAQRADRRRVLHAVREAALPSTATPGLTDIRTISAL
jgi:hypothetical protein